VTPGFFRGYPYPYPAEPVTHHWGKGFARSGYGYPRVWGVWGTPRGPGKGSNCVYMIFLFDNCGPFNLDIEDSQSWLQNMHCVALGVAHSHNTLTFLLLLSLLSISLDHIQFLVNVWLPCDIILCTNGYYISKNDSIIYAPYNAYTWGKWCTSLFHSHMPIYFNSFIYEIQHFMLTQV
jgi:hypothetical protein